MRSIATPDETKAHPLRRFDPGTGVELNGFSLGPMKRIVAYVTPVTPSELPAGPVGAGRVEAVVAGPVDPGCDPGVSGPGCMKLEVVVPDEQSQRIVAAILGCEQRESAGNREPASPEDNLKTLVQQELDVADPAADDLLERIIKRVERELIEKVYSDCAYVKSRAAARLGINRNTLLKKLREFGDVAGLDVDD